MSYDILYEKLFIKIGEDQFIPMVLAGSNNCYCNSQDRKRCRDWYMASCMLRKGLPYVSQEEMQAALDTIEEGDGIAVHGKKYGGTLRDIHNFYQYGLKCALTIEQLKENGININAKCKLGEDDFDLIELLSTEHAQGVIRANKNCEIELNHRLSEEDVVYLRRKKFPKKKREFKLAKVDHFYAIVGTFGYFIKNMGGGYKYGPYWQSAKRFRHEKEARKYIEKNKFNHGWYAQYKFNVEKVEHEAVFKVYKGRKEWKQLPKTQN